LIDDASQYVLQLNQRVGLVNNCLHTSKH